MAHISNIDLMSWMDVNGLSIFLKDESGVYRFANEHARSALIATSESIVGLTDYNFFSFASAQQMAERDNYVRNKGTHRYTSIVHDGRIWRRFESIKLPVKISGAESRSIIGISAEVHGQKLPEFHSLTLEIEQFVKRREAEFLFQFFLWSSTKGCSMFDNRMKPIKGLRH